MSAIGSSGMNVDTKTFLTLLVAQLQYQDPLSPQSDTDFVAQLAQMTSLEEIQKLNSSFSSVKAYNLVGKTAYAEVWDVEAGKKVPLYGTVESIVMDKGAYYAVIGSNSVPVNEILQVFDSNIFNGGMTVAGSAHLIGKTVTGKYLDQDGETQEITGIVTSVSVKNGIVHVNIGDTAVALVDITSISQAEAQTQKQEVIAL